MDTKQLSDAISVTSQIAPSDLRAVRAAGFHALVCARPDGEKPDQPDFQTVAAAAAMHGIQAHHLPVTAKNIFDAQADAFDALLQQLPGPVLAYCGSGWRAVALWALSGRNSPAGIERMAQSAAVGLDLMPIGARLGCKSTYHQAPYAPSFSFPRDGERHADTSDHSERPTRAAERQRPDRTLASQSPR